jgi:hypothetical protein
MSVINFEELSVLLKTHRDVEVCMNSNGIKFGFKNSPRDKWQRFKWGKNLSIEKFSKQIDALKKKAQCWEGEYSLKTHPQLQDATKKLESLETFGVNSGANVQLRRDFLNFAAKENGYKVTKNDLKMLEKVYNRHT